MVVIRTVAALIRAIRATGSVAGIAAVGLAVLSVGGCTHGDQTAVSARPADESLPTSSAQGLDEGIEATEQPAENGLMARARAIAAASRGTEPIDPCDLDENWHYDVLALLSAAVEADPAVARSMAGAEWPELDAAALAKWRAAVTSDWNETALRSLLADSEWWPYLSTFPQFWIAFDAAGDVTEHSLLDERRLGRWAVDGGQVRITFEDGRAAVLAPERSRHFYALGERWFYTLHLVSAAPAGELPWTEPLVLGPPAGDCGDYNF